MDKGPETTASSPGPIPFGPYTLVRRIGYGGMGEVFLAREEEPGRACVVKKVLPGLAGNTQFLARFRDEARVVLRLSHPNIARVWAMGEVAGALYLAMEYVEGKTLNRLAWRLRNRGLSLSPGMVLLIGERMCAGLAYAHDAADEQGQPLHLVHRDLSPANVCISYAGEVKIIDFGAAQSTLKEAQTAPSVVMGSIAYMAPEQARKKRVDRRADVYATGVVLWELLAWRPLPQKGDVTERWKRAAYPQWEPPSRHRPLPPEVDAVVLKALATEPEARFPDAAALGAALRQVREKYAPDVGDADLARLMSEAFAKEKTVEDGVLAELLRREVLPRRSIPEKEMPAFAPPTALAFEHRALDAPAGYVPSAEVVLVEESRPEPRPEATVTQSQTPLSREVRVAFDVDVTSEVLVAQPGQGSGLVQAIEEGEESEPPVSAGASPPSLKGWLAAGLFLAALAVGFLLVWLLG
ncbi:serine/threonine-protein kinase [Archangium lansingense]|uniref:Serine/threonine-protein kinase n=1 Tax=Archangium lansingense TaxID=2995310 RepID=A0ABT3ZXH7_9BACT|nr:serine/threonine-protein kinase [Archangium lansinium]MCY1073417.1 serine/threonine-protein kinase [Archangium lansinium]